jgi:competence protein ComEC
MLLLALAFLLGISLLQFFTFLPSLWGVLGLFLACYLLVILKPRYYGLLIVLLLGFAWSLWCAHQVADKRLPESLEGKTLWVRGRVASLPRASFRQTAFLFEITSFQDQEKFQPLGFIQLSWPKLKKALWVGDEWRLPLRLKRIHGNLNPGGYDYEAWAFQNGIGAKGYVLEKEKPVFIASHPFYQPINQVRQYIQEKAKASLPKSKTAPWLLALMLGERVGIPQSEWEVLRNTGTNHLMAIAGLHIGFMAALAQWSTLWLWRRFPHWALRFPAPQASACAALGMAILYSALAGFSIPTERALIMVAVFLSAKLCRRILPLWQAFSVALVSVLLLNPLHVLSSSFWLSFTTLALIVYGMSGRIAPQSFWWKWGRPQWVLALGLLPLSLWIFEQYSLVSFLANGLAIPWVGFLVLPLCFLSIIFLLLCPLLATVTLSLADKSLALLWFFLEEFAKWPWATWHQVLPHYGYLLAALGGVLVLLMPAGIPGRYLGAFWLLPILFFKPPGPHFGEARFSLLDVGQGLAAVIQTQNHTLVFDAGARLGPEWDMGESVVLPFLHTQGIKQIDCLVISHSDNDHSGGAEAILKALPVLSLKTSVPLFFPSWPARYCLAGESWQWDGVLFSFLHPDSLQLNQGNDSSCVLQITASQKRVLLTGDIEKTAELSLLSNPKLNLAADILVAPHHGSKTSGLREFIGRVHPQYVLYALGYRNRFHFPHPAVVKAYQDWGVIQYDTASSGAIQFTLRKGLLQAPRRYRVLHKRYWTAI